MLMSKKVSVIIFAALCTVILILTAALIAISARNSKTIMDLGAINDSLGYDLESERSRLESQKAALEVELSALKARAAELEANMSDAGKYFEDQISDLEAQIAQKENAIAALEADIARYETVFTIDVRSQAKLIDDIVKYIESMYPYVQLVKPPEPDENGEIPEQTDAEPEYMWVKVDDLINEAVAARKALGDAAEPLYTEEELTASGLTGEELTRQILRAQVLAREDIILPKVSVYYEDLLTGYHFDYEATHKYECASVVKAPYILSILKAVSADEKLYLETLAAEGKSPEKIDTDEDGVPDQIVYEYSDPIYNLSDVVVYDKKTMDKAGSGKIKDMPDGTEFTYIDFIKYALEYSDNVAYNQLKKRFGYDRYYALGREVKANSILWAPQHMTAADAGKLFKAIYNFIEEDEKYGQLMYDSMKASNHTVIIPYAVSPTTALHKYGWDEDSYHDAAIVLYDDKPYVLSVFSDLEMGGNEVNAYLREIVKMINKLHKGFYSK